MHLPTHRPIPEMKNASFLASKECTINTSPKELATWLFVAENLWTPGKPWPDLDGCPKGALVVLKVPYVYTESDAVGKAWERRYVTVGDFKWATNAGSLVKDLNHRYIIIEQAKKCQDSATSSVHISKLWDRSTRCAFSALTTLVTATSLLQGIVEVWQNVFQQFIDSQLQTALWCQL